VYWYQERRGKVDYVWKNERWERQAPSYGRPTQRESKLFAPCIPRGHAVGIVSDDTQAVASGYNEVVRLTNDVGDVLPVCTSEEPPDTPVRPPPEGERHSVTFTEVRHILGCKKKETLDIKVKDDHAGGDGGSRSAGRMVRLTLWDQEEPDNPLAHLQELQGVGFAQAEYFYDGTDGRDAWMWNMKWRARLRLFELPQGDALGVLEDACNAAGCGSTLDWLSDLDGVIAH
jgi:hypothetical protein